MRYASMLWGNAKSVAGGGSGQIKSEQLTGIVDGVNTVFTTSRPFVSGAISVFLNGVKTFDFSETNNTTITLDVAPINSGFPDVVSAIYSITNIPIANIDESLIIAYMTAL